MRTLRPESEIINSWQNSSSEPLVSVMCLTYNHGKYIEDALEGFLIQQTNFPFEVLIHDDASTDNTAEIIRQYQAAYPNIIKPVYQTENQWSKGKEVIRKAQYGRAKGKYYASCEGDDYWTSPNKLQKQFEYLENNPDCVLCGTRVYVKRDDSCTPYTIEPNVTPEKLNQLTADDIMEGRLYLKTLSRMCPSAVHKEYNEIVKNDPASCDWLFVLFCISKAGNQQNRIICVDEVMGCCLENNHSYWFSKSHEYKLQNDLNVLLFALKKFNMSTYYHKTINNIMSICEALNITYTGNEIIDKKLKKNSIINKKMNKKSLNSLINLFKEYI